MTFGRSTTSSFFLSGRNAAEERFWRKYVHNDGSYGRCYGVLIGEVVIVLMRRMMTRMRMMMRVMMVLMMGQR